MAERRMFAKSIVDSDSFLDMPASTQNLYFHLAMRADDDGFVNNPKSIMRIVGVKDDDLKVLAAKQFIIPFDTGVCVIRHWRIHNYIRKDTYSETKCKSEKSMLKTDENNAYAISLTERPRLVDETLTQDRLGKDRLDNNIAADAASPAQVSFEGSPPTPKTAKKKPVSAKHKYGEYQHVLLTDEEHSRLKADYSNADELIAFLDEYIEIKGYKAKNHNLAIRKWVVTAVEEQKERESRQKKAQTNNPWEGYPDL